jgi:hypothetical protein
VWCPQLGLRGFLKGYSPSAAILWNINFLCCGHYELSHFGRRHLLNHKNFTFAPKLNQ